MMSADNGVKNFESIREDELLEICRLRGIELSTDPVKRAQQINEVRQSLIGLAISGGGIRSATFGLGVLQALKAKGLLEKFDYLSTVSGGGYIGGWLTANCKRADQRKETPWLSSKADWSQSIWHLRRYSNYLSPNLSLLSADTWSMVAIWLRNTLLLQLMIVMAIASVLLIPRLALPAIDLGGYAPLRWGMAALFIYLIVWIGANLEKIKITEDADSDGRHPGLQRFVNKFGGSQGLVHVHVAILMVTSLGFLSLLWQYAETGRGYFASVLYIVSTGKSFWWFLLLPYLGMVVLSARSSRAHIVSWLVALPATLVLYLLLAFTLYWIGDWRFDGWKEGGGSLLAFAWGPPMVLGAFVLAINVMIGMQGNGSYEYVREWWSRFGAWLAIYGAAWMLIVVVAFYGPLWAEWLYYEGPWKSLGSGWLGTVLAGLLAGKSSSTDGGEVKDNVNKAKDMLAKAAPFIFIAGLLITVATGLHLVIANADDNFTAGRVSLIGEEEADRQLNLRINAKSDVRIDVSAEQALEVGRGLAGLGHPVHWQLLATAQNQHFKFMLWTLAVCLFCVLLLSWRIDINEFSLNAFYRNRLARCYLGASRKPGERQPQEFTGFDRDDDLPLSGLTVPNSPFHIVNCALNLGGSNDLSLHTRHSAVFTLTPLSCGSHYQLKKPSGEVISEIGYFNTAQYGGRSPTLGQAVSVSGAAASPNMGYHTSAPVAFLMTLFNARLGWWFPSPKTECDQPSPPNSLGYLLKELFGIADEKQEYLAISDGGHFENLAAYELLKRQCRLVIISDGECDPKLQFEGLANLIRIAEVDRLAKIDIDVRSLHPEEGSDWSHRRCAIGTIDYRAFSKDAPEKAWLIYIKAAMNGMEDTAILQYKSIHPDFPHETTGDQFYAEDQFESYRNLGFAVADKLLLKLADDKQREVFDDTYMQELSDIFSRELPTKSEFTRHADALMQIWEQLREDEELDRLDDEIFPPDHSDKPERAVFYKCCEMIQLMENVYLDLDLEETWLHPDNGGWKVLFEKWAKSPQLVQTWNLTQNTYGLRFQSFWKRYLA